MKPAMTPQQEQLTDISAGPLALYRSLAVGAGSWAELLYYEMCATLLSPLPGLLGFGLRGLAYPYLFKRCGKRPALGRGVIIRVPGQISIGSGVLVDDFAVLDVRGAAGGIEIEDYVSIGRFSTIAAKGGLISLGAGVNIGSYCRIATQSRLEVGESALIAAYCYIGPGNHRQGDDMRPLISQEMEIKGGVRIGARAWIGARATILDGVKIGEGAVVGAHALVREDVPPGAVAVGSPARIVKRADAVGA